MMPEQLRRPRLYRMEIETLQRIDRSIISSLQSDPLPADRVARLRTIDALVQ